MGRYAISVVFFGLLIVLLIASPDFRDPRNLWNVLQQNSIIGIVALGMLVMMISGGFDLSVGATGAASAVVAAWAFVHFSIPFGVVGGLLVGLLIGCANGILIAKVGINPFVTTLGMQVFVQGLLFVATDAKPIYGLPSEFTFIGLGRIGPVPVAAIIYGVVAVAVWILLRFSRFGHYVYATGGNKEASRLAGVPVDRVDHRRLRTGGIPRCGRRPGPAGPGEHRPARHAGGLATGRHRGLCSLEERLSSAAWARCPASSWARSSWESWRTR